MRRVIAAATVACVPISAACFPDYAIRAGAGTGDAAADSGTIDSSGTGDARPVGAGAPVLDGASATVATGATATMTAGTLTTTGARDVVVALFGDEASYGQMVAGSGFEAEQVDTGFAAMIEDDVPVGAAPGMHEAQAVLPVDSDAGLACWVGVSAAFE